MSGEITTAIDAVFALRERISDFEYRNNFGLGGYNDEARRLMIETAERLHRAAEALAKLAK